MTSLRRVAIGLAICAVSAIPAVAQESGTETRPASNTVAGDTGLWFQPLAETMRKGQWSFGAQRVNLNRSEGFTNISDIGGMFAFGASDRVEIFGNLAFRRLDADLRPSVTALGQPQDYLINDGWNQGLGDLTVGAKFNFTSQTAGNGLATAARLAVKLPTASRNDGLGTGRPDFGFDLIGSREFGRAIDLSASMGFKFRGDPDGYDLTNGFIWGVGAGFPSRTRLKVIAEMGGEAQFNHEMRYTGATGTGAPPPAWKADATRDIFAGLQFQARSGFYIGAGVNYAASHLWSRENFRTDEPNELDRDKTAFQVRLGYHPGVRNYVPPPPAPPAPPPAPPAAPANRPPTVKARCEPCTIPVSQAVTVAADAQDPDGDTLRYKWSSPTGSFANANDRQTRWTAPGQPAGVPVTVTVDDGRGGTASDTITIQVVAPPRKEYTFEDVHFDFDRYSLRAEATRLLDDAVRAMNEDATLRLTLEGHTCNIGTAEYNLALGERRASAVRDYLVSRGIAASRLQTVSYGEERPKHDNSREETRRLNRRAALTIRLQ
jgi:outer membrane protein OmpA-like peptidoglycan-associated protein